MKKLTQFDLDDAFLTGYYQGSVHGSLTGAVFGIVISLVGFGLYLWLKM